MGNLILDLILRMDDSNLSYNKSKVSTFSFSHTKKAKNVGHKLFWWKKSYENVDSKASIDIYLFHFLWSSKSNHNQ